jgi:hypothetical protein
MQDTTGTIVLAEIREILLLRVVVHLRLLFGIEVIQIAVELIEAVQRWQILVAIAQVVLAELAGHVALVLQQLSDGDGLRLQAGLRTRDADFGKPSTINALTGDEGGPTGGAGLLTVRVGKHHPFFCETVDVGRVIAHQAMGIAA